MNIQYGVWEIHDLIFLNVTFYAQYMSGDVLFTQYILRFLNMTSGIFVDVTTEHLDESQFTNIKL